MNDLDLLRAFGDELESTHELNPSRLRRRVLTEIAESPAGGRPGSLHSITERAPSPTQRAGARAVWGLTAAATVAAVTLVATGVTHGTNDKTDGGTTGKAPIASADLNGSQVLLLAAEHASSASTATGKYWMTATEYHRLRLASAKGKSFKLDDGVRSESWTARSDSATSRGLQQELGMVPAGAADRTAWKEAGSPATVDLHDRGQKLESYIKKDVPVSPGPAEVQEFPARASLHGPDAAKRGGNNSFAIGQQRFTLAQIRHLPTDQAALRKIMLKGYKDNPDFGSADSWVFSTAASVLSQPVTPKVRASVYRILAGLPSVKNLGLAKDIKGRAGNAVAITSTGLVGMEEQRLIIDAKSGNLLAEETRVLKPVSQLSWLKPTDIELTTVVTRSGWTDATPPAKTNTTH